MGRVSRTNREIDLKREELEHSKLPYLEVDHLLPVPICRATFEAMAEAGLGHRSHYLPIYFHESLRTEGWQ